MAQQYKSYPIERMQPSLPSKTNSTTSRSKPQSISYGQTATSSKYPIRSSTNANTQYKAYKTTSGNIVYKSSSNNVNTMNTVKPNPNYRALAAIAKTKSDSSKYIRGIVVVAPQNESTHGWIYCKATNNMYQLPYNNTKHYIPDQIVLFNPTSKLRGLNLTEARSLMMQNKLNINNYNNYFVSDAISLHIYHTKLYKLSEIHNNYLTEDSESMSEKNKFILNTFINLRENEQMEFKLLDSNNNSFPMLKMVAIMERYLNGFINNTGGTIYFGIGDDGRIHGQSLFGANERKILDEIQLKICEKLREWKPNKYIQKLIKSLTIETIDLIKIDDKEKCGYIMPNKKIIKATINSISDCMDNNGEQIIFTSSVSNNNVVYVRQLSSLCAYTDVNMQQQIGKRQINKLNRTKFNVNESDTCSDSESDIDFDDNDEKDWIDVDKLRNDIHNTLAVNKCNNGNQRYFDGSYTKTITEFIAKYT